MKLLAALPILLLPGFFLEAQTFSDTAPKQSPLATLSARVDKVAYKGGEQIQVTLTLRAGPRGAYVSEWSRFSANDKENSLAGRYMGNVSGFDVSFQTLDGKNAATIGHAGVADRFGAAPPPSEKFKEEFVFLKPGEEVSWRGSIEGTVVKPGKYQVVGFYIPDYDQVHELAGLPEAHGLLISDLISSTPVIITIE